MTPRTVTTDIIPGLSAEVRVVQEITIEGKKHFIVCTREWPEPAIYGLRDERQVKAPTTPSKSRQGSNGD